MADSRNSPEARELATLDEVALAAGVARSTASRALNGGVASPATVKAVAEAAKKLGFVPNRAARTLAKQRTEAIALVIPESPSFIFYDPFLAVVTSACSTAFWKSGLQPMLVLLDPENPVSTISRFLHAGNVDGMVVTSFHKNEEVEALLAGSGIPAVFIGRPPGETDFPYVDVDNRAGGYRATEYLLRQGRRHIACFGGFLNMTPSIDRREGFLQAHRDAGVEPGPYFEGPFSTGVGIESATKMLREYPETDAIFAQSDALAAGAIQALRAAEVLVPDDIAIVGYDNFATATEVFPNLTTIAQPAHELADCAAELMIGRLKDGYWAEYPRILPAELVVRGSA
ncbi:MAG: LacI family transcriptional regulator [Propionibacteriaceae bacterium]|nr:LacI family transcriptional regulator [Propionibacteriaceae bacterium]